MAWWCLHTTHTNTHTHKKQTHTTTHLRLTHNNRNNKNNIRELSSSSSSSLPSPFSSRSIDRDSRLLCLLHFCEIKNTKKNETNKRNKTTLKREYKSKAKVGSFVQKNIGGFFRNVYKTFNTNCKSLLPLLCQIPINSRGLCYCCLALHRESPSSSLSLPSTSSSSSLSAPDGNLSLCVCVFVCVHVCVYVHMYLCMSICESGM